ncbi:TonB-dependent receptor [Maricurvus nonylphenolicus]|uniref:TonB-dependent receptor n=1 Tax=Maricurvus nonylphenolicus TaxID=1008307 RepID=UPI0036F2F301
MKIPTSVIPLAAAIAATTPFSFNSYADDSLALEEIVVTAQRREESLNEVPLAVTSIDAEAMAEARIEDLSDISKASPSITAASSNNASATANVTIRGIGTVGNSRSFEGAVGIFIDGVYRTRAASALESFVDVGGVQVIRGPQGTLFGKNTSAGAVLINSTAPSLEELTTDYSIGFGNFGSQNHRVAVNIPVTENSAIRVAALYDEQEGFIEDVNTGEDINGKDTKALKFQWLWEASEDLSIHVIADSLESNGNCCYGTVDYEDGDVTALTDFIQVSKGLTLPSDSFDDFESALNHKTKQRITDEGLTLKVEYDTDIGTLTSTSAYRHYDLQQKDADGDFNGADILRFNESFDSEFYSQELTFSGEFEGALNGDYIVGLFYSKEDIDADRQLFNGADSEVFYEGLLTSGFSEQFGQLIGVDIDYSLNPLGQYTDEVMTSETESIAIFSHVNIDLNEQWKLVAGLRYSEEEKSGSFGYNFFDDSLASYTISTAGPLTGDDVCLAAFGNNTAPNTCLGPSTVLTVLGTMPGPEYDETNVDRAFSGTLGLQYFPSEDTMVYITYNRGFKAGGVNFDASGAGTVENNPAITPGATPLDPSYDPETIDGYELGMKTTYWGGRAQTNVAAFYNDIEDLQVAQFIGLQFTILNAKSAKNYGIEFENLVQISEVFSANLDAVWIPHAKYGRDDNVDPAISNQRMKQVPHFSGNASLNFDTPLTDDMSVKGRVQYQYGSSRYIMTSSLAKEDSVGVVNASLSLVSEVNGWQLDLWGLNLTDEADPTVAFTPPGQVGDLNAYLGSPRTYGVTLRGSF